jgi:hypothetical protein
MGDLTAFLYQRMRDYCIGMISSRWRAKGANVCVAGNEGLRHVPLPALRSGHIVLHGREN